MKTLVFKKWYSKKNWRSEEICEVEKCNVVLVGATEKAIICEQANFRGGSSKLFFPKSAVIVMEENDVEHFEEMNKYENAAAALEELNEYLKTTNFATKEMVNDLIKDCATYA